MVEAILYRNELVVVINEIIATKISLQYMIFIAMTYFVVKTYYRRVYCNGLQRLTFVAIKVYCNEMVEVITYRNKLVVVINEIIATKILLQYMIFKIGRAHV